MLKLNEAPSLWPLDAKSQLFGKDPDAGKYWEQEEKGTAEEEMVGWDHWPNGHEFEQASGDSEGQRGLACCSPWGCKELDTTEWLNNNNKKDLEILLLDVLTRLKTYVHTKPAHSFIHNFKIWKWPRGLSGGEWIHYYIISSTKEKGKKKLLSH